MTGSPLRVIDCLVRAHDLRLVLVAALVCAAGVYASFAVARHAARGDAGARLRWGAVSIVASGCTAWATHFIVLLAFHPHMPSAFAPATTALSLGCAIVGIAAGIGVSLGGRTCTRLFVAGLVIGAGVAALHYVGQSAYLVRGTVAWDPSLVAASILLGVPLFGLATAAGAARRTRPLAPPLMLVGIATLHFCGMAAMTLHADPRVAFPTDAVAPATIAPIVAGVSLALLALAVLGWRFDLAATVRLRRDRRRLRQLADVALEGLLIAQGDRIVAANSSMERLSGYDQPALTGAPVAMLLPGLDIAALPEKEEREAELLGAGGQAIPVRVLRSQLVVGDDVQTVVAVRDQRERLRTEAAIRTLAFHDTLTGLPNRGRFHDLLVQHAASRRDRDRSFAVLMIDLDRFKPINDTLGHAAGDVALRLVADRLRAVLRDDDVVARFGGDEFAVLQSTPEGPQAAAALAARIVEAVAGCEFRIDGHVVHVGASVGYAWAPDDGEDPARLMRSADLALYAAKADGKGTFRRFDPSLDDGTRERRALEEGLRRALSDGQLEVHYQPLVDARSGRITAAEALVRWRHPQRGLIPPADFVGVAEETGLIVPLGAWVLRTACAEAARWPGGIGVAVNLSPAQFRDRALATLVASALADAGLPPARLELEITEGVLLMDEARTLDTLTRIRAQGVRIAMDDFGTGYSSLGYLRRFPFDRIKIDRSFIAQVPGDADSVAIVRAIITMGACLGLRTTVEGVETAEQYAFSVAEGCDSIQGYHVSRPLVAAELADLLATRRRTAA